MILKKLIKKIVKEEIKKIETIEIAYKNKSSQNGRKHLTDKFKVNSDGSIDCL